MKRVHPQSFYKGISLYAGLGHTPAENEKYLQLAASLGYTRLFTSLHIPEAKPEILLAEFAQLTAAAAKLGFHTTADIAPDSLALLQANPTQPQSLAKWHIHGLRLDYGFSPAAVAALTKQNLLTIALNASALDEADLAALKSAGAVLSQVEAWHNFYPRPETGLSLELFCRRSRLWREQGIAVFTFIPSQQNPRAPIGAGLPTLELHRSLTPSQAASHLQTLQLTDGIVFGDPLAAQTELAAVAALSLPQIMENTKLEAAENKTSCLTLHVNIAATITAAERDILLAPCHTNRLDPGAYAIRSQEARSLCHSDIPPEPLQPRFAGSVTIDNQLYKRYMGELQIVLTDRPAEPRSNVVAQIISADLPLLPLLTPGTAFRLLPVHTLQAKTAAPTNSSLISPDPLAALATEKRNPASQHIDQLTTAAIVSLINQEDQKVAGALTQALPAIAYAADSAVAAIRAGGRLIYIGAGTSGRLGILDAAECPPTYGTDPSLVLGLIAGGASAVFKAVEGAEDSTTLAIDDLKHNNLTAKDFLVAIAASGRTPYALSALCYAKTLGCHTLAITCSPDSAMEKVAETTAALLVGPEVITGSSRMKAGTAQKMALNMLSTTVMIKLGKVYGNLMVDLQATNSKLLARARRITALATNTDPELAAAALRAAGGSVKTAIVMLLTGLSAAAAAELLRAAHDSITLSLSQAAAAKNIFPPRYS